MSLIHLFRGLKCVLAQLCVEVQVACCRATLEPSFELRMAGVFHRHVFNLSPGLTEPTTALFPQLHHFTNMTSILCPRAMRLATNASVFPAPLALARAHYSSTTASSRPFNQQRPRPAITAHILASRFPSRATASSVRNASTATSTSAQQPPQDALTWDRFFDLRRKRRFINLGASIVTAGTTVLVVGPIIAQQDIDSWAAQLSGMDPMIVLGLSTFAVAGGGWLCGPSFGNAMFSLWASRRGWNKLIAEVRLQEKSTKRL